MYSHPASVLLASRDNGPYFVKRLIFNQEVAPIFGLGLLLPVAKAVNIGGRAETTALTPRGRRACRPRPPSSRN